MLYYIDCVIHYYIVLCYIILYHVMLHHITLCYYILCHTIIITTCHIIPGRASRENREGVFERADPGGQNGQV